MIALEFCRACIEATPSYPKVVILAPSVPMVRQRFESTREFARLKPCVVIGSAEVDTWGRSEWQGTMSNHNVLITTPQLFLDTLDKGRLQLSLFTALVVEECQHCSGRHPYARIFRAHYSRRQSADHLRVLGLARCLVKRKVKAPEERHQVISRIEKLMRCQLVNISEMVTMPSPDCD